jgi:hypothetical protein
VLVHLDWSEAALQLKVRFMTKNVTTGELMKKSVR